MRVAVFAEGDKAREAEEAGADVVGSADLAARIEEGFTDFDVAIATPDQLVGSRLGPTGDLVAANKRLRGAGVTALLAVLPMAGTAGEVLLQNRFTGVRFGVPCSVLVDCSLPLPNEWSVVGEGTVRVGDCVAPRTVLEAVREGRLAAMSMSQYEVVTG